MIKYKYFYSLTAYLIPDDAKTESKVLDVTEPMKPNIISSSKNSVHEVKDNYLFYTGYLGEYQCIVYTFKVKEIDVQVVKYKPKKGIIYNMCLKASDMNLTFLNYEILPSARFTNVINQMNFDMQEFFDYNYRFIDFDTESIPVFYAVHNDKLLANVNGMILYIADFDGDEKKSYVGKFSANKLFIYDSNTTTKLIEEKSLDHIKDIESKKCALCYEIKNDELYYTIWYSRDSLHFDSYFDERFKLMSNYHLTDSVLAGVIPDQNISGEIYTIYIKERPAKFTELTNDTTIIKQNHNGKKASTAEYLRHALYNSNYFGEIDNFNGTFEFMIKIHRNIIRNLYEKYIYINVLDIGIGKCRDVHTYQKYVNADSIYGVEPNPDFAKECKIVNMFAETADSIFHHFKEIKFNQTFQTIIFCNSYNFVTDPYITMKECEEVLQEGGRIIIIYMNNDAVETVKNKYYEIRKKEPNPELPSDHVLKNRQNFIQVFTETTLVPPHYENQISEQEILDAVDRTNKELKDNVLTVIEKGSLVHNRSKWLIPEAKLFNSMFYYCVIGKKCTSRIIIAFDPDTKELRDYILYLRGKSTFCNGVEFKKYNGQPPTINDTTSLILIIDNVDDYKSLTKNHEYQTIINMQTIQELEYSILYPCNLMKFNKERQQLIDLNIKHSRFGIKKKH